MNLDGAVMLGSEVGCYTSREHQRIAEILHDYDHTLTVVFVPADQRDGCDDFPYAVLCTPDGQQPYVVRRVRNEDMNENLLAWTFYNDQQHGDPVAAVDAATEAVKLKRQLEIANLKAEQYDFVKAVLKGKNWFRHNGRTYQ